jgi:hypothetical protein
LKGVAETLDENDHISATTWLLLDDASRSIRLHRRLALLQQFSPTVMFSPTSSAEAYKKQAEVDLQGPFAQGQELPESVHLLSLEQRYGGDNNTVLRLQHLFEAGEDGGAQLAQPVTVDVSALIDATRMPLSKMTEMSLSANLPKTEVANDRLVWKTTADSDRAPDEPRKVSAYSVQLKARQIKTFVLNADPIAN